jgi:hypothetical protein
MATSFVDVLLQLRDELGADVLSGGKIQTDAAGTTTPLATYQDLAGATPNTNPVILDSSGMAVIRQTNGVAYKWRVYDSDDNLLWTRDNITVGASSSASDEAYLVHLSYEGTPAAQGFMGGHIFDASVTFPIDWDGAQGSVQTNPASTYTISIKKNDVEVGTAAISTAGAYTFDTTGGTTVSFSAGDKLTFIAPDSAGTAADFIVTLAGEVA